MGTENNPNELNKNCLAFGMQLFQAIQGIAGSTNIIISPVSIHLGLGLIYIGAAGKTAEEIKDVARLFEDKKETANAFLHIMCKYWKSENIHIANKLYVQEGNTLKSEVQRIAQHSFKCDIENLDFGEPENAAKACNKWVADKTNQKVKEVLTPNAIDPLTKAVLINVVYFKCDWKYPFKRTPQKADFWINETESVKVEMMIDNADEFHYGDFPELDCTAVELPFTNENFAMFFLLPKKKNGIETLESNWDKFDLVGCRKRMEKARVAVNLPKFRVDFSQKLNEPLIKMGITTIFDKTNADFSELLENTENVHIDEIIHKTFIDVNTAGVEAGAVTISDIIELSEPEHNFMADHPFLYAILSKTNKLFFLGIIRNPAPVTSTQLF